MTPQLTQYQSAYETALQRFRKHPDAFLSRRRARLLGTRAVKSGLSFQETLNVHTCALLNLLGGEKREPSKQLLIGRASVFYGLIGKAMSEKESAAVSAPGRLKRMVLTLQTRTKELAASNRELKHESQQRKAGEKRQLASEKATKQLLAQSLRMEEELRFLSRRLLAVQEEERKQISRELHDVIAQALAGINLRLADLQSKSVAASKDLHQRIEDTRVLVQQTVEIVHRFARDLRPSALDDLGFIPAVQSHIKSVRDQSKLSISFRATPEIEQIGMMEKIALFRVIQEALFNVVQHAKATQVSVSITSSSKGFRLRVRDNGKGFSIPSAADIVGGGHLGLLGMRERIEMIGGTFSVESTRGKFAAICALLPHPETPKKAGPK